MKKSSRFKLGFTAAVLVPLLVLIALAWGQTVNIFPNGVATPKWYTTTSSNRAAAYYLAAPTLSANDTASGLIATQTFTNKTLTTPIIASFYQDAGKTKLMTTPSTASDTLAAIAATQTLTNKTLTTPIVASFYQDAGKTQLMTAPNTPSDTLVTLAATQSLSGKTADVLPLTTPRLTTGTGTGLTVNDAGSLRTQVYKVTLDKTNFVTNGVNHDVTIATMPAKTIVHAVLGHVSQAFACTSTCTTATLAGTLGISAGGVEFLASFDMDAAVAVFGDTDAEVGSALTIAGNTNGGYHSSFTGTTTIVFRGISGTGAWGSGTATNLSAGSVTFYILYSLLP
jgi:hypothetical protein